MQPIHPPAKPAAGHAIDDWRPEDPAFWASKGKAIATRNLWISIPNLLLAFAVWMVWSVVIAKLPSVGFNFTTEQLFWLAALPGLSGATLRIFYSFMVPVFGGRLWTTLTTASLIIPAMGIAYAVQNPETPYLIFLVLALLCGLGGGNFASSVALRGVIEAQAEGLIRFAHGRGMTLTLIETMPLGETGADRLSQYLSLAAFRRKLARRWTLADVPDRTGGPASYVRVTETGGRLGFITPLTCNFCAGCNRVRVSSTGRLYTCMGHEGSVDLRAALRNAAEGDVLPALIAEAIARKPKGHAFEMTAGRITGISRHMSTLGG